MTLLTSDINEAVIAATQFGIIDDAQYFYGQACELPVAASAVVAAPVIKFNPTYRDLVELRAGTEFTVGYMKDGKIRIDYPGDFQTFRTVADAWDYLEEILIDEEFYMLIPATELRHTIKSDIWSTLYFVKNGNRTEIQKALKTIKQKYGISIPNLKQSYVNLAIYVDRLLAAI